MKKTAIKIIAITLVLGQALSPALAGFRGISNAGECPSGARISVSQLNSFSSVIVVINTNVSQQARQLVELACLCSTLAARKDASTPTPSSKNKKRSSEGTSYGISPQGVQLVKYEQFNAASSWQGLIKGKFLSVILLAGFFAFLAVCIHRRQMAARFYRLARGAIDDIIITINYTESMPPLAKSQRGFFIFRGGHHV